MKAIVKFATAGALVSLGHLQGATVLPAFDNFSTGLGNWSTTIGGASWNSTTLTAKIDRGFGGYASQGIQLGSPMELATGGYSEVKITFDLTWSGSMFGSKFALDYSADNGLSWSTVGEYIYISGGQAVNETLTPALGYSFTDLATFRIVVGPTSNTGSGYVSVDNISITAIPEPSAAILGGVGALLLLRRRRI